MLVVSLFGSETDLSKFEEVINDSNGVGRKLVTNLCRNVNATDTIANRNYRVSNYFLNDYYSSVINEFSNYELCLPTRDFTEKLITTIEIYKNEQKRGDKDNQGKIL